MKKIGRCLQIFGLLVLPALAGCNDPAATLNPGEMSPISDVPIPAKFDLQETLSRDWSDGSLRFVDHIYEGSADKLAVMRFYERQMPQNRWEQLSSQRLHGRTTLDYIKDQEKCRVTIYDKPGSWHTALEVTIWPHTRPDGSKPMLPKTPAR